MELIQVVNKPGGPANPIWLDIETGGIDPSQSSILSIAAGHKGDIRSQFARPTAGTFLSSFSEREIVPQLKAASSLSSERNVIESLIMQMEASPSSPIAGFNIRGFDLGFIRMRARNLGLEKRFDAAIRTRQIIDPIEQVKDVIAQGISRQANAGTFNQALNVNSWQEAEEMWDHLKYKERPVEYNLIAQMKGYLKSNSPGAQIKGWKLEDINSLLDEHEGITKFTGKAHEAATDLLMTERVHQAVYSGKLEEALKSPAVALSWMNKVKARGFHQLGPDSATVAQGVFRDGRILNSQMIDDMGLGKKSSKFLAVAGVAAAVAAGLYLFSGKDDTYNSIEGLPHGNFAQEKRLELTEFGSGWKGLKNFISSFRGLSDVQEVKRLGTIQNWGQVFEMKGMLRGKQTSFVRKMGHIGENEGAALSAASRAGLAPRVLSQTDKSLDMAKLGGTSLEEMSGQEVEKILPMLETAVRDLHKTGYSHGDLHLGNVFLDQGKVKFIDFGDAQLSNPTNLQKDLSDLMESARAHAKFNRISGKDDAHNTIEGLRHGGIAQHMRKGRTPFGSGWDALRNLTKGKETFEKMLSSTGFKEALSSAREVKVLGEGAMGKATMMESSFRGQSFKFVRKTGNIGESEAEVMQLFQDRFAPTVYGRGEKQIDMELFEGSSLADLSDAKGVTPTHLSQMRDAAREMHSMGIGHSDYHAGNVIATPHGIGVIDFGGAGRLGHPAMAGSDSVYTGFVKNAEGKMVRQPIVSRHPEHDLNRVERLEAQLGTKIASSVEDNLIPRIDSATDLFSGTDLFSLPTNNPLLASAATMKKAVKKENISMLNKSTSKTAWVHGKNGGRKARM